mmetsp:Transcript_65771/g.203873  ORF Transcript_65771/g.203873 Transcript_65771/m.203873 type:complete len:154 (+) Transcript_65771:1222-1683(+)
MTRSMSRQVENGSLPWLPWSMAENCLSSSLLCSPASRCRTCGTTTESHRARALCEKDGHVLDSVKAERTRWECCGCKWDVSVLNGETPHQCFRCHAQGWKQVSLRRVKTAAPMERDLLLPRGEELPFLNSLPQQPGQPAFKRFKEAKEDYAGL